jgi:uncharacterized membrane protein
MGMDTSWRHAFEILRSPAMRSILVLVIGTLPLFVGLAVVMPILGHSTWHLYRKLVERSFQGEHQADA